MANGRVQRAAKQDARLAGPVAARNFCAKDLSMMPSGKCRFHLNHLRYWRPHLQFARFCFHSNSSHRKWHMNCACQGMRQTTTSSRKFAGLLGVLALLIPINAPAETSAMIGPASSAGIAFARYIASVHERDAFTESGPVAVKIEASLPGLYKETHFLAIRETVESERSEYRVLNIEGDAIVAQEVIARYLLVEAQLTDLPPSSVAITPENYKFHYKGEIGTGSALAYVYSITPKKKRDGLIQGQLWIDSETGAAILQAGRLVRSSAPLPGKIEVVRSTQLLDGSPQFRSTHVTIETRAGRGELTITEIPLSAPLRERGPASVSLAGN
jgi:hypothetical protein